ncbi:MAG: box helicase, partial [Acidimicrobiales bacterium]|nr:box helicase [Acidimicrobiales bacterium]
MSVTFDSLGVPAEIARRLAKRGIDTPSPIQAATIPDALYGRDLCGKAPTGSGKTIAFGIPMVARVPRAAPKRPKGLVLTPTRELAIQVADELRALGGELRVLAVYGGAGIEPQIKQLRAGVDIVVACPGRLLDVIERGACDLRDVRFAVVDEADRMADMGFLPDVRRILDMASEHRQTLLFSATLDGAIDALVKGYQKDPVVHEVADEETGDVVHHFWASERPGRAQLTAEIIERTGPTIVFSRTRHGADRIAKQLAQAGVSAAPIHGGRSQGQRERALGEFHRGAVKALVATDVAARGIHVEGVLCVVHFDIPADHKDYIHRSGRTGRAGNTGTVVALVPIAQKRDAAKLRKLAGLEGELREPDVTRLPEGHATFKSASSRGASRTEQGGRKAASNGARRARTEDRFRTDAPAGA